MGREFDMPYGVQVCLFVGVSCACICPPVIQPLDILYRLFKNGLQWLHHLRLLGANESRYLAIMNHQTQILTEIYTTVALFDLYNRRNINSPRPPSHREWRHPLHQKEVYTIVCLTWRYNVFENPLIAHSQNSILQNTLAQTPSFTSILLTSRTSSNHYYPSSSTTSASVYRPDPPRASCRHHSPSRTSSTACPIYRHIYPATPHCRCGRSTCRLCPNRSARADRGT